MMAGFVASAVDLKASYAHIGTLIVTARQSMSLKAYRVHMEINAKRRAVVLGETQCMVVAAMGDVYKTRVR